MTKLGSVVSCIWGKMQGRCAFYSSPHHDRTVPLVMTFSATDPSGGAGMQADLLTIASMGCHPLSVVTAVTVQDTSGVDDILPIDPEWVVDQARANAGGRAGIAFKIGCWAAWRTSRRSRRYWLIIRYPLILDPVLASGRGDELANEDMLDAMRELLIPQTTIITRTAWKRAGWR